MVAQENPLLNSPEGGTGSGWDVSYNPHSQIIYSFFVKDFNWKVQKNHLQIMSATKGQTCNNTWNTSIPPEVLSFQVVFGDRYKLMEDIFLLMFWPVSEGM